MLTGLPLLIGCASTPALDPMVDYRYVGKVVRDENGDILRSARVLSAFKALWACPATGLHSGACPGWAIDHVIPFDCGGADAVWNLQWLHFRSSPRVVSFPKITSSEKFTGVTD